MKPQLLLLPGLLCDHSVWTHQVNALQAEWDCRVPEYASETSINAMARRVLDMADDHFALAGHSMGGRVALEVVRLAPDRVTHLALLDTGHKALPPGATGQQEVAGRQRLVEQARREGMRAMGWAWMQGMVHPDRLTDEALCTDILDMIERRTPDQFAAQQRALIGRPDATPVLQTLSCPVQFICGRQDQWSPLARHHEMAALCPLAEGLTADDRVTAIEDSGHMSTMERPQAVSRALADLLARQM